MVLRIRRARKIVRWKSTVIPAFIKLPGMFFSSGAGRPLRTELTMVMIPWIVKPADARASSTKTIRSVSVSKAASRSSGHCESKRSSLQAPSPLFAIQSLEELQHGLRDFKQVGGRAVMRHIED